MPTSLSPLDWAGNAEVEWGQTSGWENLTTFQRQGQVLFTLHSPHWAECPRPQRHRMLARQTKEVTERLWHSQPLLGMLTSAEGQNTPFRQKDMEHGFSIWGLENSILLPWDLRPTLACLTPKSIKSEKGHSSLPRGALWKSQVVYRHQTMTQMCAKGGLCCRLSHTCACSLLNGSLGPLLQNQLAHPMISASSREHLVTDHWVSVPIYLHRLGRLHGRSRRWAALKCVGNKRSRASDSNPERVNLRARHFTSQISACLSVKPWCRQQRALGHVWESNTMSVRHLMVPGTQSKWNQWPPLPLNDHHHLILGTERTWTIWICLGNSMYFQRCQRRTLSTSPKHHHYLLPHTHTSEDQDFPSHGCAGWPSAIKQPKKWNTGKGGYFPSTSSGIHCT